MPPDGSPRQQLAIIDGQLANIATTVREARGNHEDVLLDDLEDRYDRLLDARNRVAAMLPAETDA